ncbi:MAG: hypothetical protein ABIY55_07815, partial [Kofleriaceae bacterium]
MTPQVVELQLLAGDGNGNGNLDGVGAAARFSAPEGMAIDYANVAYLADLGNAVIRKITPEGVVTTFAGTAGARGSDDGTGAAARFLQPTAVAVDTGGNVYVADQLAHTIRKITTAGVVTTLAGSPNSAGAVDGDGAVARFNGPNGIAVDLAKNLYVADEHNHTIRKITPAGVVSTLAGTAGMPGGTDGTGAAASFQSPSSLTIDSAGNLYVVQAGNALRKVTPAGVVTTVVSNKGITFAQGVTTDGADNLYVADRGRHVVLKVTPAEDVTVVAGGDGIAGIADGAGPAARFNGLSGIVIRSDGTIYVSDTQEHTLRAIAPSGTVTTLAGTPSLHGSADGTGADARFFLPGGVAVDRAGTLYVA